MGVKKAERMLLVTEPPEEAQGKWATDCRNAFEGELRKYVGFPLSPSGRGGAPMQGGASQQHPLPLEDGRAHRHIELPLKLSREPLHGPRLHRVLERHPWPVPSLTHEHQHRLER